MRTDERLGRKTRQALKARLLAQQWRHWRGTVETGVQRTLWWLSAIACAVLLEWMAVSLMTMPV